MADSSPQYSESPLGSPVRTIQLPAPRWLLQIQLGLVALLAAGHLVFAVSTSHFAWRVRAVRPLLELFDVGQESNLPTLFSAANLWLAAGLVWVMSRCDADRRLSWTIFAAVVALLGFDEVLMLHERLGMLKVISFGRGEGVFYYSWYWLLSPVILTFVVLLFRFSFALSPRLRHRLWLAAGLFLGGSIGCEMIESVVNAHGFSGLLYVRCVEEVLEMLGVIVAIFALHSALSDQRFGGDLRYEFAHSVTETSSGDQQLPSQSLTTRQGFTHRVDAGESCSREANVHRQSEHSDIVVD